MKFQIGDKLKVKKKYTAGWLDGSVITGVVPFERYTAAKGGLSAAFSREHVEVFYEKDEDRMTTEETVTKAEFEAFKAKVVKRARKAAKEYGWCDVVEKLLRETRLVKQEDNFKPGTVLTVGSNAFVAYKSFGGVGGMWTFASATNAEHGLTFEQVIDRFKTVTMGRRRIYILRDGVDYTHSKVLELWTTNNLDDDSW